MRPYQQMPIQDCGEPLQPFPAELAVLHPHPYQSLGADYGDRSPFCLRSGVISALLQAQQSLQNSCPGWSFLIFDAYRPVAVQAFMVNFTFEEILRSRQLSRTHLSESASEGILQEVYKIWAPPNPNPLTPPPHSTGAAVDLTLQDVTGQVVDMGGEIDELSPRSEPNHYAQSQHPAHQAFHQRRELLKDAMTAAGFQRHPSEWWHFSLGDQYWAWLSQQQMPERSFLARYGRAS
ncbi:MAG: M15 family metallopeptidase [Cyanobacteria bacterium P01_H01_bin.15]